MRKMVREMKSRRRETSHDRGARGRANRRSRVGIRESHSLAGEPIDVRGLQVFVALTAEIHPTEVVDEDEKDVRLGFGERGRTQEKKRKRKESRGHLESCPDLGRLEIGF